MKCTVTKRRGTVFKASAAIWGGSGCHGAKAGCRALEDGSGKEGEPKASGAERAGNIAITVNHSKARRTRQVDTGLALTNFASIPCWRNCTFT